MTANFALAYFLWTPLDVPVRASGQVGGFIGIAVAAAALFAFSTFALANRGVGREGRQMGRLVLWILLAIGVSLAYHGGVLGPTEYTGNFVFRNVIVLSALIVGHRLAAAGHLKPRGAKMVGVGIVAAIAVMMGMALASGVVANNYVTQGVNPLGTASGEAVQAYIVAYAVPLLFLIKTDWVRSAFFGIAIAAVAMTFRRGALIVALVPILAQPFLDSSRTSGRRWQFDLLFFAVLGAIAIPALGFDRIFARWIGLLQGEAWALSERDLIYPLLVFQWLPLDLDFLIGHGIGSTVVFLEAGIGRPIFAHNDWLELMTGVGLFGILPFIFLHFVLASGAYRALKTDRYVGFVAVALYLQFALSNWIEGLLYAAQHGAMLMFFLGACLGWAERLRGYS